MARAATTTDVFNALGDGCRRDILDVIATGEATVGDIVDRLALPQPQISKHLKVLRAVDVVRCRSVGRHRLYRVHGPALQPLQTWLERLTTAVNEHYDRLDDYLVELQRTQTTTSED
jgi:DNA-binding transcriptional ArsR family regulator